MGKHSPGILSHREARRRVRCVSRTGSRYSGRDLLVSPLGRAPQGLVGLLVGGVQEHCGFCLMGTVPIACKDSIIYLSLGVVKRPILLLFNAVWLC